MPPHSFVFEQVTVTRGGVTPLDCVDAEFPGASCTAVVGPSGAGKSTLARLFNRLADPDTGRILLDAVELDQLDILTLRRRVGLVAQRPTLVTDTVAEEVRVGNPDAEVGKLLIRVGLPEQFAHRRCAELSGGEAQRVCLARALAVEPEWLVLDEPTSALDGVNVAVVGDVIREHVADGGGVVLISHDEGFVDRIAERVLTLAAGKLELR